MKVSLCFTVYTVCICLFVLQSNALKRYGMIICKEWHCVILQIKRCQRLWSGASHRLVASEGQNSHFFSFDSVLYPVIVRTLKKGGRPFEMSSESLFVLKVRNWRFLVFFVIRLDCQNLLQLFRFLCMHAFNCHTFCVLNQKLYCATTIAGTKPFLPKPAGA